MTHMGTSALAICPADSSASVMMPIAFWASFAPWLKAMKPADTSCMRLKSLVATCLGVRKNSRLINTMITSPIANPNKGDRTMASRTDRRPVSLTTDQPPCTRAAPTSPPINA